MSIDRKETERVLNVYKERAAHLAADLYAYSNLGFLRSLQNREYAIVRALNALQFKWSGAKILEVGCGSGHWLNRFLDYNISEAHGIDLLPHRIAEGKKHYPHVQFLEGEAQNLPYSSSAFDFVYQMFCLSSVGDISIRRRIIDESWRVVKPGGILLSYDFKASSLFSTADHLSPISQSEFSHLSGVDYKMCKSHGLHLRLTNMLSSLPLLYEVFSQLRLFDHHSLVVLRKRAS